MRWLRSYNSRIFAFLLALIVALVAVYTVGATRHNGMPSSSSTTSIARGAEETNGPASFIGHASNAVMFIQWTRSGSSVTGSLREATAKVGSLRPESTARAFTGVIAGKSITLNLRGGLGESTAYVGEVKENGFTLAVPYQGSNLITIDFEPGDVPGYDAATKRLLLAKYPSPCSLYVVGHEVRVSFSGLNSAEACASFVQHAIGSTGWTTSPRSGADSGSVICELQNRDSEKALITDNGGQAHGKEVCNQLSGEGMWIVLVSAGQMAKPPEWAAVVLIFGVGLALVAAVMFMASVFERNVAAGHSQNFNYWALGIASISALLVVIGTIETLHINSTPVEVATVVNLVLVLVALRIAFRAPCVSPGTVERDEATCQYSPKNETIHGAHAGNAAETVHEASETISGRSEDEQRDGEPPKQGTVIDGEPAQSQPKPG